MRKFEFFVNFNNEGLGDRFVLVSAILNKINDFNRDAIVYFVDDSFGLTPNKHLLQVTNDTPIMMEKDQFELKYDSIDNYEFKRLTWMSGYIGNKSYKDFYEAIDFFHFKRPKNKIKTVFLKNQVFMRSMYYGAGFLLGYTNTIPTYDSFLQTLNDVWEKGTYSPIDFSHKEKEKNVCYMLYDSTNYKGVREEQFQKFKTLMDTFPEITFIPLENIVYKYDDPFKNTNLNDKIEILSKSHFIFATEGMWTHLSRAMKINTIAHSSKMQAGEQRHNQINNQGHYSSFSFDDCLEKVKNLCEKI